MNTPAQWNQIRAARERNEARNREEQNSQTKAQNNRQGNLGSSGSSGTGNNTYKTNFESKEKAFTYGELSKMEIPVMRTFSVSDNYFPTIAIDAKHNPYGIYSGGKKVVMVYQTYGSNKGNYEANHFELYGQGSFEIFNSVNKDGVYEGNWDGKKMSGTYTDRSGKVFSGNFENFIISGEGSLTEYGIIYKGTFTDGDLTNIVSINYGDGIVYEGQTAGKLRHGYGYLTYKNGQIQYLGNWSNDKKNGEGAIILENGNHLIGVWVDDKQEGEFKLYDGAHVFISSIIYKGGSVLNNTQQKKTNIKTSMISDKLKPASIVKKPVVITYTKKGLNVKTGESAEFKEKPVEQIPDVAVGKYDDSEPVSEGLIRVHKVKYGFIDAKGKLIIPLQFDYASNFHQGLAMAQINQHVGFIDKTGKIAIPLQYADGMSFSEELAPVKKADFWGFIDSKGKTIIPFTYDDANPFTDGIAVVKQKGETFKIDNKGNRQN